MKSIRFSLLALWAGICMANAGGEAQGQIRGVPMQQPVSRGAVKYNGVSVQYILFEAGGAHPRIGYIPPASIELDKQGRPNLLINDPVTKGRLRVKGDGKGVMFYDEATTLAQAVQDGEVPPDTQVEISFRLRFHDNDGLKALALAAALDQIAIDRTGGLEESLAKIPDARTLLKRTGPATVVQLRLVCDSPGLGDVVFQLEGNPSLSQSITMQGIVPAAFVSRVFTRGGARFRVEFHYYTVASARNRARVHQTAKSIVDAIIDEIGDGEAKAMSEKQGQSFEVLVTRDGLLSLLENSRWQERVTVDSDDPAITKQLLEMVSAFDTDAIAVTNVQAQEFIAENYQWREARTKFGKASFWDKVRSNESLTDAEEEEARAFIELVKRRKKGKGGIAAIVSEIPIGLDFSAESESENGGAQKEQRRESLMEFLRQAAKDEFHGEFPIPADVDLLLVSKARFRKVVDKQFNLNTLSKVFSEKLSSPFSTDRPDVQADPRSDAQLVKELETLIRKLTPVEESESNDTIVAAARSRRQAAMKPPVDEVKEPAVPRSTLMTQIQKVMKIAKVEANGNLYGAGATVLIRTFLTNHGKGELRLSGDPKKLVVVGNVNLWISRADRKPIAAAANLPREGTRYRFNGNVIMGSGVLKPGHSLPPWGGSFGTGGLAPGKYQITVEYTTVGQVSLDEKSVTIEVVR